MNPCQRTYKVLIVSLTVLTLFMSSAQAKKPDNPGGSDPGNGGALELLQLAPDAAYSAAWAVNDARLVVGQREGVAGVWDASLAVPTFLPLNGDAAEARDVNADDEIVGWGPNGASYWSSPSAPPIELPISAGLSAYPEAISREGVIVGRAEGSGGDEYAAAWYVDNDIVTGPLVLSADAAAFDVASLGSGVNRVVGASLDPEGKYAATAWDLVVSATGTLTVTNETILLPDFVSRAYAITEGGDVAGSLADANPNDGWPEFPDTAFVLRDGTMRRLSSGRQYSWGAAYDLNDADVVGAIGRGTPEHAAQWDSRNKLGNMTADYFADSWSNSFAASISAEGSIVGHGVLTEEIFSSAWILRRPISATSSAMAIPEPASGTILCLALVGLAIRANRSRRRLPKATDRCADQSISVNSRIASQLAVLTLIVLEASFAPSTEAQSLEWVQQFGTSIADHGRGISLDGLDNLFVTGSSVGSNTSDSEVFLRKHDSDGSLLWTRSQVLSEGNSSYSVAADSAGNAYITGSTWGDLSVNPDDVDAFLTKYAPDGQLIWTQQFGSNLGDESLSVSSDGAGNTYVGGVTWGDLEGPIAGMYDAFVRKYDTNGNLEWGQQFGTDQYDGVEDVFTDALGNLYVGGFTWGSLEGSNAGIADAFVRKYDAAGSTLWTRQFGTPGFDNVWGIHVDVEGNVYLAGSTEGDLGGMNAGQEDAFVRVYDADGDLRWTRQLGYSDTDIARAVATDAFGNVYLGGDNYADQGANTFVSKYDSSGDLRWTSLFGTEEDDSLNDIVSDERGNIFLVGSTWGDLGAPNAGLYDAYLAKVSNIPEPSTIFLIAVGAITVYLRWPRVHGRAQILILLSIALVSMETTFVAAAQFIPLGFPSGEDSSISHGISPDGSFVVGSYSSSFPESFRWDELGGFESLGDLPAGFTFSQAHDASVQGEVVVGTMENEFGAREAFRWTSSQGIVGLGVLPGMTGSLADAVSADGSVVVGSSFDDAGDSKAFRWTEVAGIEELDFGLQPSDMSRAFGVSADGLAVVGSNRSGPEDRGFHWTQSQGVQLLDPLPGDSRSAAFGISADGSVFVGDSFSLDGNGNPVSRRAVRWNGGGVAQDLGTLFGDDFTVAIDASTDGSVIFGMSQGEEELAFLWTENDGMRPLVEVLMEAGLDMTGWDLRVYNGAISDDGSSITGWGRNPDGIREAWVARLTSVPEPSTFALLVLGTSTLLVRRRRQYVHTT